MDKRDKKQSRQTRNTAPPIHARIRGHNTPYCIKFWRLVFEVICLRLHLTSGGDDLKIGCKGTTNLRNMQEEGRFFWEKYSPNGIRGQWTKLLIARMISGDNIQNQVEAG
jgi:hypothetical protein